jgi:general secretion pathway protein D
MRRGRCRQGGNGVKSAQGRLALNIVQNVLTGTMFCALLGCAMMDATKSDLRTSAAPSPGVGDQVRGLDLSPRFPTTDETTSSTRDPSQPLIFPGAENDPEPQQDQNNTYTRVASVQPGAVLVGQGVEMNFEGADIKAVAKTLLGDVLKLNVLVDPRVQGNVTLASVGAIPRKDLLSAFESALRMSNAAIVREGNLVKIVPLAEAGGNGAVSMGAGQPGFGVSIVPLRYVSASTVAKTAEGFLSRPGAMRVIPSRNLVLIQGTTAERQSALDLISTFDVEWLRNQSVAVYPLKSTSPETMIGELERIFESGDGGVGQGVLRFQPISRMNAVMAVTRNPKLLTEMTQWVQRLDRSDTTGTTLRTYRLKNGSATKVAKILNDIFAGSRSGTTSDTPTNQLAPGTEAAKSRLDSLDQGKTATANNSSGFQNASGRGNGKNTQIAAAFDAFADRKDEDESGAATGGGPGRGIFQNVRITADTSNNAIVVYSNQEDYRVIERALRDVDRPRMQVAIDATVAEITLTDDLRFGVQYFLTSKDVGAGKDKGSIGLLSAAQTTAQSALLQRITPGLNFLIGSEALPRVILNALSTVTDVKVLSSPSIVAMDNQPALLQVGDEVPITTSTATLLTSSTTPQVNTIEMRNTGVILKVLPHVNANGAIHLEIDQEISNVVNPDQQTLTPTIAQRRVHSAVAVVSGQTVLLAGLISEREQQSKSGIPGLRDIKFLGDLLGNTTGTKQRSEIIIFIRTRLMRNSIDASSVTEEFREKLQLMRSARGVVEGAAVTPASNQPPRRK